MQTQAKLILMEMRLRHHSVSELLHLQYEAIARNLRYLKTAFIPSLVIVIPMIMMLPSLDARFQHIPARIGTIISVEVILSKSDFNKDEMIKLNNVPPGLKLIEMDGQQGLKNVMSWHFRAIENGVHSLKFNYGEKTFEKRLVVSDKIPSIQRELKQPGFIDYLYSLEPSSLEKGRPIEAVAVSYKKAYSPVGIFGWRLDWLYSFMIIFLILFFAMRPFIKVY